MESEARGGNVELEKWLSIATRKLCPESQERIRKEIEEHYLASVEDGRARGYGEADSERLAIETLGNTRSAARSFRKHHLTKFQAGLVKDVTRRPPKYRFYLYTPVLLLAFVMNVSRISGIRDLIIFVCMLAIMLAAFASHFWWATWLSRHRRVKASVTVDMLSTWVFFASMQFGSSLLQHHNIMKDVVYFVIYGSALLALVVLLTPLLRKMGASPSKSV